MVMIYHVKSWILEVFQYNAQQMKIAPVALKHSRYWGVCLGPCLWGDISKLFNFTANWWQRKEEAVSKKVKKVGGIKTNKKNSWRRWACTVKRQPLWVDIWEYTCCLMRLTRHSNLSWPGIPRSLGCGLWLPNKPGPSSDLFSLFFSLGPRLVLSIRVRWV